MRLSSIDDARADLSILVTIRLHLSLEALPPAISASMGLYEYVLPLTMDQSSLDLAAREWDGRLADYPER